MVKFILDVAEMAGVPPNTQDETFGKIQERQKLTLEDYDSYWYTVELLVEAGFLLTTPPEDDPTNLFRTQLSGPTWAGHDLLDKLKAQK
jgi:hypothetical protein